MRIAISGMSGCGNTTTCKLLAEKLGYPVVNYTFRQMAQERNMDFWEFSALAETDFSIDRDLDSRMVKMALQEENCVLGSRLAIWNLKDADLKVYLNVSAEERARRVVNREGGTYQQRLEETQNRDNLNRARYLKIYGIDNTNPKGVADLVIDADNLKPEEVVQIIYDAVCTKK